jgi:aminoglycoside phosphotransferase (APT) family kinase protein
LIDPKDAVLLEVVTRELEGMAAENRGGPVDMAAQLLRTIDQGGAQAPLATDRGLDVERLGDYLAHSGVIAKGSRLTPERSALGYSKDTYLVSVAEPGAKPFVVVVRRDLPGGPSRTTVVDEFPLVNSVHAAGLPVAEPLLVEADPGVLGRPFLVSRGAAGIPDFNLCETDAMRRETAAADLAGFLARLHSLAAEDVDIRRLAPGASPRAELAAYFREWRGFWDECGDPRFGQMAAAYDVLERRLPDISRLAVVHSDVGFHNILVDAGRITAVLDWEFSHLGEPEEDLAYARKSIETLVNWDRFLEMYSQAGGPALSPARIRAYEIWRGVRNATCCALGLRAFENGLNADLRLAYAGRVLLGTFVEDMSQQLQNA